MDHRISNKEQIKNGQLKVFGIGNVVDKEDSRNNSQTFMSPELCPLGILANKNNLESSEFKVSMWNLNKAAQFAELNYTTIIKF